MRRAGEIFVARCTEQGGQHPDATCKQLAAKVEAISFGDNRTTDPTVINVSGSGEEAAYGPSAFPSSTPHAHLKAPLQERLLPPETFADVFFQ